MKESGLFPSFDFWQEGYDAFTFSVREKNSVIDYVIKQKEHHKRETFPDEYKHLLSENKTAFEEKYLFERMMVWFADRRPLLCRFASYCFSTG